ncbi:hypothetical protein R1flu_023644 [Riccia fluitans]|uniref:Uncharacterized protein n=1 Tax=Riccia fluitans TaxID=41844 RepID=A0ABD1XSS4_9MARC
MSFIASRALEKATVISNRGVSISFLRSAPSKNSAKFPFGKDSGRDFSPASFRSLHLLVVSLQAFGDSVKETLEGLLFRDVQADRTTKSAPIHAGRPERVFYSSCGNQMGQSFLSFVNHRALPFSGVHLSIPIAFLFLSVRFQKDPELIVHNSWGSELGVLKWSPTSSLHQLEGSHPLLHASPSSLDSSSQCGPIGTERVLNSFGLKLGSQASAQVCT